MLATTNRSSLVRPLALILALAALPCCAERRDDPEADAPEREVHVYTVRGEVNALPSPTSDLRVRHEAIPEFIGPSGTVEGMGPMIMAFWPPQGLSLEQARVDDLDVSGIEVGDKVTLVFEVIHDPETKAIKGYYATSIETLPDDTVLDFSPLEKPDATE